MNLQVLRKHKYELSNMSINAITEKELLEAIYQKV